MRGVGTSGWGGGERLRGRVFGGVCGGNDGWGRVTWDWRVRIGRKGFVVYTALDKGEGALGNDGQGLV